MDYSVCHEHPVACGRMDANKNGSTGWQTGEGGLAQAQTHMDLMVRGDGL